MSVKLTTNLSQRIVLTPQLRQRIEMLQMTSLELSELIQQQMLENPVLEEVSAGEEKQEIEEHILDQLASGGSDSDAAAASEPAGAELNGSNGAGDLDLSSVGQTEGVEAGPDVAQIDSDFGDGEETVD